MNSAEEYTKETVQLVYTEIFYVVISFHKYFYFLNRSERFGQSEDSEACGASITMSAGLSYSWVIRYIYYIPIVTNL